MGATRRALRGFFAGGAFVGQLPNLLSDETKDHVGNEFAALAASAPGLDSWVWLPARAFTGEPLALALVAFVSIGLFTLAAFGLADSFIASAVAAGGAAASKSSKTRRSRRFQTNTVAVMRRKELRLLGRDPWLMTQVGQQMIYVVPALVLIWAKSGNQFGWLIFVFLAGMLAAALAWLTISGEDAPDLLGTAPVRPFDVLRAKLEAALLPVAIVLVLAAALASPTAGSG